MVERFQPLVRRARKAPGCLDPAITADPIDPSRINNFGFPEFEAALAAWRPASHPPKLLSPMLQVHVKKHIIQHSGPPF